MKKFIIPLILFSTLILTGCSASTPTASAQPSNPQVEYYFTRAMQHPDQALESQINSAKSTLDIAIYSLTKKEIVNSILNAKKRDVKVRIITDHAEAKMKSEAAQLKRLKSAGITIKDNTHSGLMHLKVSIIDHAIVTTGSYNYTEAASKENDEILVVMHDPSIATNWDNEFQQMWNDTKNYKEI